MFMGRRVPPTGSVSRSRWERLRWSYLSPAARARAPGPWRRVRSGRGGPRAAEEREREGGHQEPHHPLGDPSPIPNGHTPRT